MSAPFWDKIKAFFEQGGVASGDSKNVVRLHLGRNRTTNTEVRMCLAGSQPKRGKPYDPDPGSCGVNMNLIAQTKAAQKASLN